MTTSATQAAQLELRVLVVDDEPPAREELIYLVQQQPGIAGVYGAADGVDALAMMATVQPHVLLLDIQMPRLDGIALAQSLSTSPQGRPEIIFTTAYDDYAVKAFEVNAVDYLLKPVQPSRLAMAIARLRHRLAAPARESGGIDGVMRALGREPRLSRVPVEHGGRILLLDRSQILYITTDRGETMIRTQGGSYPSRASLQELERRLGPPFLRVHKGFVVDLSRVGEVIPWFNGSYYLVLNDPDRTQIPVGRQQVKLVQEMLGLR